MVSKSKISFVVPEDLQKDLRTRVIKDDYGFRGKSKWVSEAVEQLLNLPNFPELVNYGDEMHDFEKAETIVVDYRLKEQLEQAMVTIRKQYPMLEGLKSQIVRTAILQRLLRG